MHKLTQIRIAPQRSPVSVDIDRFANLYRSHVPRVYGFMRHFARNHFEAEDLTADAFERALRYFHSFDPTKGEFMTWLFTISMNVVKRRGRSKDLSQVESPPDLEDVGLTSPSLEENYLKADERRRLGEALAALRERHFRIVALKFGGGLTNREIAQVTGLSESNVGSMLSRSLKNIGRALT